MKKYIILFLSLILIIPLVGCSRDTIDPSPTETPAHTSDPITEISSDETEAPSEEPSSNEPSTEPPVILEIPEGWSEFSETLSAQNGRKFEMSFILPEDWQNTTLDTGGGILNDSEGRKRIGTRFCEDNTSFENFTALWIANPGGNSSTQNIDSPFTGHTYSGIEYLGYENGVFPGGTIYNYILKFSDDMHISISVVKQVGENLPTFYEDTVLPIINSIKITEITKPEDIVPDNTPLVLEDGSITDISAWDLLPWKNEPKEGKKNAQSAYNFINNFVSGKSTIPELNGLLIRDYTITLIDEESYGATTIKFTFYVEGFSLYDTFRTGRQTKYLVEGPRLSVYDEDWQKYEDYEQRIRGLYLHNTIPEAKMIADYLTWMCLMWEVQPYGEWDAENYMHVYNFICKYYGDENMSISFSEMQKILSEKFGINVELSDIEWRQTLCSYDPDTGIVRYADTRGYPTAYRITDFIGINGVRYITVQLYADPYYIIPSHKVKFKFQMEDHFTSTGIFLGYEIAEKGKYEPLEFTEYPAPLN